MGAPRELFPMWPRKKNQDFGVRRHRSGTDFAVFELYDLKQVISSL